MSVILDKILHLIEKPDEDWTAELKSINIYEDVASIYSKKWPTDFCNRIVAFIVLAYDNKSGWIELHKDRWDNKYKIASRLGLDIKNKTVTAIIENSNFTVNDIVAWFVDYQTDWRWDAIVSCFEYASEMMRFAKTKTEQRVFQDQDEGGKMVFNEVDIDKLSSGNMKKGQNIEAAISQRKRGEELLKEIEEEFVQLNTVMHKEGKRQPTDLKHIESWEIYIKELRGHE